SSVIFFFFFFFFRAEDGIRDLTVTGVQTCALPISAPQGDRMTANGTPQTVGTVARIDWVDYAKGICIIMVVMMHSVLGVELAARSEERRVGKECRSRWSREQ